MFRTAVLRAALRPRAAVASSSIAAGLRHAATARSMGLTQAVALSRPVFPALSRNAQFRRSYSTSVASAAEETSRAEPESAASSDLITRFADLTQLGVHDNLIQSIVRGMGYENMTLVQSMTIAPALAGKDIVAQAKTGTGKTLAFLIPIIQRIIQDQPNLAQRNGRFSASAGDIRAIILSPTRELAEQIGEEARNLVRGTGIVVQTAVGGTQKQAMLNKTRREGCHLLVATPGRLNDILSSNCGIGAPRLSALVLDEADRMLDVGFERELNEILQYLPSRAQVPRQTLLFSATIPKNVVSLARTYVDAKNFEFVQTVRPEDTLTHEKVPQHVVAVNGYENIYPTILELVKRETEAAEASENAKPFKAIVFLPTTNFVQMTQMVFNALRRDGVALPRIYHIHSKLTQSARTGAANTFRAAQSAILFSSDVTARGMDFPNVTHVIQVGLPPDREQYIHRLGRTGRADKGGQGWAIIAKNELHLARNILTDLPIQRVSGLTSAEYDMTTKGAADEPEMVTTVSGVMKYIPKGLMTDTYLSFFGGSVKGRSMQTVCDNANNMALHGWGLAEVPAVSTSMAQKRGLLRCRGMNIQDTQRRRDGGSQRQFDNYADDDFERQLSQGTVDSSSYGGRNGRDSGFSRGGGYGRSRDFGGSGNFGSRSNGYRDNDRSGGRFDSGNNRIRRDRSSGDRYASRSSF